jgi:PIN domain nuclease of toxin-antitoxin system
LDQVAKTAADVVRALDELRGSNLAIVDFTERHVERAAMRLGPTRRAGLSLGDRACLALALERDEVALSADRAWLTVPNGAKVELIR